MADLLVLELHKHVEDVEDIVEKANKESKIDAQLKKIADVWKVLALEFVQHKQSEVRIIRVRFHPSTHISFAHQIIFMSLCSNTVSSSA